MNQPLTFNTALRSALRRRAIRVDFRGAARIALTLGFAVGMGTTVGAKSASAANPAPPADSDKSVSLGLDPTMSLDPSAPQIGGIPGVSTPTVFSPRTTEEGDWKTEFHGLLVAPLNAGIGKRANPLPGQSGTVLHAPPVVPDDLETFSHTGVVPTTYAQMNFSTGNGIVSANVSILARQANASTTFLEPSAQQGITDLFVSIAPPLDVPWLRTSIMLGSFSSRYGATGEYDEGRYGTPLIARIRGVGEQISARALFGNFTVLAEQGFMGQGNKASSSVIPTAGNEFADPASGATFINHVHAGIGYKSLGTLGLHYIRAFSQDDRAGALAADGIITIAATDVRLTMGRFGHLYAAVSRTNADNPRPISRILSVLNTQGGRGLIWNYLSSYRADGEAYYGKMTTVGGQYDLSVGRLVSYPEPFNGDGPDIYISVFGMLSRVTSSDKTLADDGAGGSYSAYDGVTMRKVGLEGTYSLLSWLATSVRYDQVAPNTSDDTLSFGVISPRVIFRSQWLATNQLVLEYAHWFNGSRTTVRAGDPPRPDVSVVPDTNMVSLSATMWW